jgi:signal transduction histidine kinase
MLKSDVCDKPQALVWVEEIERSIESLNNVVSNVLHFAKNNKLVMAPVNVHAVVNECVHHFASLYAPAVSVSAELSGNPFVLADEQGLRQALYNLVMNALQAGQFRGRVSIAVRDDEERDGVHMTISDDGPGIPEEVLPRLFEPFVSGKPGGTGLGLSIVRRLVEAHAGSISAANDNGAVFTIRLPRKP